MIQDLFEVPARDVTLVPGATLLCGFARRFEGPLVTALQRVVELAPLRRMVTPGGHLMSVAMTSCGAFGWITDRRGYRYEANDPESGHPWPPMPDVFAELAAQAAARAGFDGFAPDACLINRYEPGARMSLHQDKNERDYEAPFLSSPFFLRVSRSRRRSVVSEVRRGSLSRRAGARDRCWAGTVSPDLPEGVPGTGAYERNHRARRPDVWGGAD